MDQPDLHNATFKDVFWEQLRRLSQCAHPTIDFLRRNLFNLTWPLWDPEQEVTQTHTSVF